MIDRCIEQRQIVLATLETVEVAVISAPAGDGVGGHLDVDRDVAGDAAVGGGVRDGVVGLPPGVLRGAVHARVGDAHGESTVGTAAALEGVENGVVVTIGAITQVVDPVGGALVEAGSLAEHERPQLAGRRGQGDRDGARGCDRRSDVRRGA